MASDFPYQNLKIMLGENLIGIYEYKILNGITWILVVKEVDLQTLEQTKIKWQKYPFIIFAQEDINQGLDTFPLQYLYIKHHVQTIEGPDLWSQIQPDKAQVRLKLEQELRNKLITFREEYLQTSSIKTFATTIIPNFVVMLEALFFLKGKTPARDFIPDLETIEKMYQVDLGVFKQLWNGEKVPKSQIPTMIQTVHDQLLALMRVVDQLKV